MAEETKKADPVKEEVGGCDVPVAEESLAVPEKIEKEEVGGEKEKEAAAEELKIDQTSSFKEESNKVDDLIDREKRTLDEFKALIRESLSKREFTAPAPAVKEEEKVVEEAKEEEAKVDEKKEEPCTEEKTSGADKVLDEIPPPVAEPVKSEPGVLAEKKTAEETIPPPAGEEKGAVEKAGEKPESLVEEIKETIIHEVTPPAPAPPPSEEPPAPAEENPKKEPPTEEETAPPPPAEEVSIWGIRLLADEKSDVVLLKFLRARDFKVKEALAMLKNVVAWRKSFKIDELLEEEGILEGLEKVVYVHGVDREGHPVCYNAFGEFQDKELYDSTFADTQKRDKFLKWYIQFLEKNVRKLDFSPDGTCTIVQITDLKNSPGLILFKKELRQATNQALQVLQDNYPEFVARQVFINVPWWYVAYNRMISPFFTQRTKSKFVFAGPTKTADTLFKYLAPEQVPVQYGGLSKEGEQEFTTADAAIEETIKPACKHIVELPINEACTLVWEVRVVGWDVTYGAEFAPSAEGGYNWIVQKPRKIGPVDEQVISCTFKIGEPGKVVLTFDNQASKKKKLLYRSKINTSG